MPAPCYRVQRLLLMTQRGLVVSAQGDSPGELVAPIVLFSWRNSSSELDLSQWGWTSALDWERKLSPDWSVLAGAELTPWHGHASNLLYAYGKRARNREFRDTSTEIRLGIRRRMAQVVSMDARILLNKEWISGAADELESMWRSPYIGFEVAKSLEIMRSYDPYRFRFDGWRISATVRGSLGAVPFWRASILASAGRKLGVTFIRASVAGLRSSSSNLVAQWLVGGSWDALGATALYGHPYAEYRISTAVVGNGGVDLRVYGEWELGVRTGVLASSSGTHHGQFAQVSTIVSGLSFYAGVGLPDAAVDRIGVYAGAAGAWAIP